MAKAVLSEQAAASTQNIYQLDGKVPLLKAIPFGLQHILAMFVANLTPITLIGAASGLDHAQIAVLLQNAMFVAGIATLIQLYPIWKIGSRLPVVMGVSFTFVTILSYVGTTYGYPTVMGAVLIGGLIEGTLGLLAKYWRKIITPVVAASVVTAIGYSLFTVGTRSFGGGYTENFGSPQNLLLGTITLVACLLFNIFAKGYWKQLSVLAGLLPPVGNFFASLPESVLGGCTLMMFGTIMVSGIQMISKAGFSQRNVTIVALSLAVGIGFTSASEMDIWRIFPQVIQDVFSANCVAVVFVMSILLSALLPKDMEIKRDVNAK